MPRVPEMEFFSEINYTRPWEEFTSIITLELNIPQNSNMAEVEEIFYAKSAA